MSGVNVPETSAVATAPRFTHAAPAFRTFCGDDALSALPRELARTGAGRVLVVTSPSMRRHPSFERVTASLGERLAGVFDGVREHSPVPTVRDAATTLRELGADAVVAVGGGSAVVTARAASILLAEGRDVRELCTTRAEDGRLASPRLNAPKLPNWVVPSTPTTAYARAGSAVRDPDTGDRLALFDPKTRAHGLFLDPVVAASAPAGVVRAAALNAFSMAVEGLQVASDDPLAEAALTQALRMLARWLPRLADDDPAGGVRLRLMSAALLSGRGSEFTGGGLAQALSHAAGPRSAVPNGVVEALLLPHVVRFNADVTGPRLGLVAECLTPVTSGAAAAPERVATGVAGLLDALGLPRRLREAGLHRDALPHVVDHTLDDWFITRVPRPADRAQLEEILRQAY